MKERDETASAVYCGQVVHHRSRPKQHRLRYDVFSLLLDLDELSELHRRLRLFSHNAKGLFSFFDRDHGEGEAVPLRDWVDGELRAAGIELGTGRVRVLCYPRIFGFVFNPLTVYYCYTEGETLLAMLYEVSNTFNERHTYVIPAKPDAGQAIRQDCSKAMYVSPFNPMENHYYFALSHPGEQISVVIRQHDEEGPFLAASFKGRRRPLTDRVLMWMLCRYPLMTFKVVAAIHWEALKLWWKGVPVFAHSRQKKRIDRTVVSRLEPAE